MVTVASGELAGARFYDDAAHDWQRHRVVCSSNNNGGKLGNGFDVD